MPGPPLTLVYRPDDAASLRTNLAISYLVMSLFSVTMLYVQGLGTLDSLLAATHYLPAVVVGFFAARMFVHRVHATVIKRMVLWSTVLAGAFLFARTIVT